MRILSHEEYRRFLEVGLDFCDCCGSEEPIEALEIDVDMPDENNVLVAGADVCQRCIDHAHLGPCQPDKVVQVLNDH